MPGARARTGSTYSWSARRGGAGRFYVIINNCINELKICRARARTGSTCSWSACPSSTSPSAPSPPGWSPATRAARARRVIYRYRYIIYYSHTHGCKRHGLPRRDPRRWQCQQYRYIDIALLYGEHPPPLPSLVVRDTRHARTITRVP